ncbi:MAG: stage II sporulation protein M [Methanobrevibacter sp.]|nr:stage II sporulation protein M [Methanobrevibacter sp.]
MINEIKLAFSENKMAIYVSIAVLFISLVLGYILEPYLFSYLNPVVEEFTREVESGVLELTFTSIFSNNIRIVLMMFIYGIFFCFSLVILSFNGFFVGYYVATTEDLLVTVLLIIPHGIFEFSSCILACASGLVLFNFVYKFLKAIWAQESESFKVILTNSFNESSAKLKQAVILFIIASVLMAVAGVVEAYLTVPTADWILSFIS